MIASIEAFFKRHLNALLLCLCGWKRRKCLLYGQPAIQWQDPESNLWYYEGVALQLFMVRARHQT